ncbi:MAG: DUF1841 family protein, partial [Usitatibacter sp.]
MPGIRAVRVQGKGQVRRSEVIFNPSRDQSREFLFDLWDKHQARAPLTALESMALAIVLEHPEYQAMLA